MGSELGWGSRSSFLERSIRPVLSFGGRSICRGCGAPFRPLRRPRFFPALYSAALTAARAAKAAAGCRRLTAQKEAGVDLCAAHRALGSPRLQDGLVRTSD